MEDRDRRPAGASGADDDERSESDRTPGWWRPAAHYVRVCLTPTCEANGGGELTCALEERLGIGLDGRTAGDAIALEGLECIGLCGIEWAILIDDQPVVGRDAIMRSLDELR